VSVVTTRETVEAIPHGSQMRYRFKYTFDNGEVHYRRAWVPAGTNEADERNRREGIMLNELANAEANQVIG
jgi:hypothetical protein